MRKKAKLYKNYKINWFYLRELVAKNEYIKLPVYWHEYKSDNAEIKKGHKRKGSSNSTEAGL